MEPTDLNSIQVTLNFIQRDVSKLTEKFDALDKQYVQRTEFEPIKKLVYGAVALALTSIASLLLAVAYNGHNNIK